MKIRDLIPFHWKSGTKSKKNGEPDHSVEKVHPFDQRIQEFEDMASTFFRRSPMFRNFGSHSFSPKVNVRETNNDILVEVEMPGMDEKDIQVTLENGQLVIRGEKKEESETKKGKFQCVESSYGRFERSIPIPEYGNIDQANASYKKGLLTVTIGKDTTKQKVNRIPISV